MSQAPRPVSPARPGEFRRGGTVVAAAMLGVACGVTALPFFSLGAFVQPLGAEFGWSRGEIQAGMSLTTLGTVLMAPAIGWAIDRFGARPVALASLVGLSAGLTAVSQTGAALWQFYLGWVLMALLGAGTTPITWTRAVAGWFATHRGLALGLMLMGTGLTATFLPPFITDVIAEHGWRTAYLVLAAMPLLLALPAVLLFFRERDGAGENAPRDETAGNQAAGDEASAALARGFTPREAFAMPRFWLMFGAFALVSIAVAGLVPSLIPLLRDQGMEAATAARVAGAVGIAVIAGRLVTGFLLDRLWAPGVAATVLLLPLASCWILAADGLSAEEAFIAAALLGFAAGAEFDLIAFLTARYFGMRHYGKIYALQYAGFALGAGIGPALYGFLFDAAGGYDAILLLSAALFAGGAFALLPLGRYPVLPVSVVTSPTGAPTRQEAVS